MSSIVAKRLLELSALRWESSDRLSVQVLGEACLTTFAELRSLEIDDIFVESMDCSQRLNLQESYNLGQDGALGEKCILVLNVPRQLRKLVVARDLDDLLSISGATSKLPKAYILTHDKGGSNAVFCYTDSLREADVPAHIRGYHSAIRMWEILESQAHHTSASGSLLFFSLWKVEIAQGFQIDDLRNVEAAVAEIDAFISNSDRQDTRREIFTSSLAAFLRDQNPSEAFAHILRGAERFARRLREGLALFLFENSPEKLAEEGRKQHFELAEKLEKTVNTVELKALSIPLALLLVVKQAEPGNGWTVINGIMVVAVVLYWLAMTIAHLSHLTTLKLVRDRVGKAVADLEERGLEATNPLLSSEFRSLNERLGHCFLGVWVTWIFSFLPIVAVVLASFLA